MAEHDVDVLIAGAGPVGLMAALSLARSGVSVRLVDAADGPATTSRALAVHARSLETYDQLGLLGEIAPQGTRVNAFIRHEEQGTDRLDFDFTGAPTGFPFLLNVDQVVLERALRAQVAVHGVDLEWGTALESFEQDDDGVTAVLRSPGREEHPEGDAGRETVRARYLWGCDGGHSTVRKALDLPLEGESAHTWLIADAIVDTGVDRDGVHWLFPGGGAVMLFAFPEARKWRLLDTTGAGDPEDPGAIARQFSAKLTQALGQDTHVEEPSWASRFTIQQRAVPAMHVGRCFVSGDAAHVHSPASGQGLNTGVQEAYNLAWKLAMVLRGEADAALLETYDAERVPVGQALLESTGRMMATVIVDDAERQAETSAPAPENARDARGTRDADSAESAEEAEAAHRRFERGLIRGMSGLQIAYTDSPLTLADARATPSDLTPVGLPARGPRPGERLPQIHAADAQTPGWTALRDAPHPCLASAALRGAGHGCLDAPGFGARTGAGCPAPGLAGGGDDQSPPRGSR
ncbi:FAD-dependent oxidoreductase [Brachybacterium endophyticum]|uniref:FAD-dependent oxidoreductase n=1 Tax=Brachybacterium endophyticum TaxID=2182385 RepID=UPI00196B8AEC|nr:FAD-dependent oxidoreductase [Brachybacterium endophyticum]